MQRHHLRIAALTGAVLVALAGAGQAAPGPAGSPPLRLPIACTLGKDCLVQQYADHDASPGARDYRCGSQSYEGHDGTDIRLATIALQRRGVAVLAAADGVVRGLRDGEPDRLLAAGEQALVKGRECGNGVAITHGGGWETQYCHMARGSIAVRAGQQVKAGTVLGRVGLSGNTQFPHVHLTLRHNGSWVDPFAPLLTAATCGTGGGTPAWTGAAAQALAYRPAAILDGGFAGAPVTMDTIEQEAIAPAGPQAGALVYYLRAIGLQQGDILTLRITAPDGTILASNTTPPMDRAKAQWLSLIGKRRPPAGWSHGAYRATGAVLRKGQPVASASAVVQL